MFFTPVHFNLTIGMIELSIFLIMMYAVRKEVCSDGSTFSLCNVGRKICDSQYVRTALGFGLVCLGDAFRILGWLPDWFLHEMGALDTQVLYRSLVASSLSFVHILFTTVGLTMAFWNVTGTFIHRWNIEVTFFSTAMLSLAVVAAYFIVGGTLLSIVYLLLS